MDKKSGIDGYVAEVECVLDLQDRYTYYFTSHMSQLAGVCWGADFGCDCSGRFLGNAGIIPWKSVRSAKIMFSRYAKVHDGDWKLLRVIPVRWSDHGFEILEDADA